MDKIKLLAPRYQTCIQIDCTNACTRKCSNCTRLLSHCRQPFFMDIPTFEKAVDSLLDFIKSPKPYWFQREKVIGVMGGEPCCHSEFKRIAEIMEEKVPPGSRGLWTGIDYPNSPYGELINRVFSKGYINWNIHERSPSRHQPILTAVGELVADKNKQDELINNCWLQHEWSSSITPKGCFCCEVMASMDMVFNGPGGLPIEKDWWKRPIEDYRELIEKWCYKCGCCIPLPTRFDYEGIDDITKNNLEELRKLGSPRIEQGKYHLVEGPIDIEKNRHNWNPVKYR